LRRAPRVHNIARMSEARDFHDGRDDGLVALESLDLADARWAKRST
jgi:hypothetical protein